MGAGIVPTELVEIAFRRKSFAKPSRLLKNRRFSKEIKWKSGNLSVKRD